MAEGLTPKIEYLCRDCEAAGTGPTGPKRCPQCGSPRMIAHDELFALNIAHIDCDAFYASVEKRDNPELAGRAVIIGGAKRGVVATCCYMARLSGVHSAMPIFQAKRLCPEAVIVPPRMKTYVKISREIRRRMDALTPLVEPLSIDEAFLDLSGTRALFKSPPVQVLAKFANDIEREIGITVSVGLSHNKFLAKIASDLDKPRGMAVIGDAETTSFLAAQPVEIIYGIGKSFAARLHRDGITRIGQLQKMSEADLGRKYGEIGLRLARLSTGQDGRRVQTRAVVKSVSHETTFFSDIDDLDTLSTRLLALSELVAARLKARSIAGDTVTLKLKTAGFALRTRARHLLAPTQLAHAIYETGFALLEKEVGITSFRLIGVAVSGLGPAPADDPVDLVDPGVARKAAAERAMDKARARFGDQAVLRGKLFQPQNSPEPPGQKPNRTS
ncbi:MAG: DNA polymerase IV [Alphaproteobacteria bacterium]|nr:DNA polymerase IV [Alphaproteobacteria bacterium]